MRRSACATQCLCRSLPKWNNAYEILSPCLSALAKQTGLDLTCYETPKTGFLRTRLIITNDAFCIQMPVVEYYDNTVAIRKHNVHTPREHRCMMYRVHIGV